MICKLFVVLSILCVGHSLDLAFDSLTCDTSLPTYADDNGITMTCNGSDRCSLGDSSLIMGSLVYNGLENWAVGNNTGYVSAKLQLMTMEYELFEYLPFNFCGDWVVNGNAQNKANGGDCPSDGRYYFAIPYTLPENHDLTTWFATGWEGVSYLKIYKNQGYQSAMLANCKVHFKTFVTGSDEENWYSLPSAAQTTLALFAVLGLMCTCCLCLACRPETKHPTDEDYQTEFSAMEEEDPIMATRTLDEENGSLATEDDLDKRVRKLSLNMKYLQAQK